MSGANLVDRERLRFRRQFLWARTGLDGPYWAVREFGTGYSMSTHLDLEVHFEQEGDRHLCLLGTCYDPLNPELNGAEIARWLLDSVFNRQDLIRESVSLSGRWAIFLITKTDSIVLHDACGFRSVFYSPLGCCGSDPNLLRKVLPLERDEDPDLVDFVNDPRYQARESAWVGARTLFKECRRLLPNHYLDLSTFQPARYFPSEPLKERRLSEVVEETATILQGSIEALMTRGRIAIPLTAGLDSRVILAASRAYKDRIAYFVDCLRPGMKNHPDIWVPSEIAVALGLRFEVNHLEHVEVPDWFHNLLKSNVSRARDIPKMKATWLRFGKEFININGNGSEVSRHLFSSRSRSRRFSAQELASVFSHKKGHAYATREILDWLDGLGDPPGETVLDFLYWEQHLGNWGAHLPAEQDISIEEVSPFNCRRLVLALWSLPRPLRAGPRYEHYQQLLDFMWPETLDFPINPIRGLTLREKARVLGWHYFPQWVNILKR